jgi:large subunit ribosomal protein L7e
MALSKIAKSRVPEGLAKKRTRFAKQAAAKAEAKAVQKKNNLVARRAICQKARAYAAQYAAEAKALVNNKKAARAAGNYYVDDEPKLAMVIRIRGINQLSPKPKKTLQLLRLRQIGNCCFVRLNKASIQMLRICDPFIAWGYPTVDTMKKLIYKRGAVKINGQRIKIVDNSEVEKSVGHLGINCVEDLIHEIYTVGPNFKEANNSLYPIKLSCPRGGWKKITNHFIEGGDFGNREAHINQLAAKMN